MDFTRKKTVELYGFRFECREMTLAVQREIDAAVKAGGSVVEETVRRCVYYDGKALGDEAPNLGYSMAIPLVDEIQKLAALNPDLAAKLIAEAEGGAAPPGEALGAGAVAIDQGERPASPNGLDPAGGQGAAPKA